MAILEPAGKSDTTYGSGDPNINDPACQIICLVRVTSIARLLVLIADKNVTVFQELCAVGLLSWLGPLPEKPVVPYCQTISFVATSTSMCFARVH